MLLQQSLKLTLRKWIRVILILNKLDGSLKRLPTLVSHNISGQNKMRDIKVFFK